MCFHDDSNMTKGFYQEQVKSETVCFLKDLDKNGNERPWKEKKRKNVSYYEILEILESKKAERVSLCNVLMEFDVNHEDVMKLKKTWFCKSSLCPICNWRKSMKHSEQAKKVVAEVVRVNPKARWLFLTLSAKNLYGKELSQGLRDLTEGFRRLMQYKRVKQNLVGFMRTTEITVNSTDGTYNQHLHVLLCVTPTYFKNKGNYMKQEEWTSLWRKAMKLDYKPIVNIQSVKPKHEFDKEDKLLGAIYETSKYAAKDSDYLTGDVAKDVKVVGDLENGLYRKRLIAYGGYLKTVHNKLNLKGIEKADLININEEEKVAEDVAYRLIASWNWRLQNYTVKREDV